MVRMFQLLATSNLHDIVITTIDGQPAALFVTGGSSSRELPIFLTSIDEASKSPDCSHFSKIAWRFSETTRTTHNSLPFISPRSLILTD
jgi:hypothetical protein